MHDADRAAPWDLAEALLDAYDGDAMELARGTHLPIDPSAGSSASRSRAAARGRRRSMIKDIDLVRFLVYLGRR
jgi:hypothetical protein